MNKLFKLLTSRQKTNTMPLLAQKKNFAH